MIKEFLYAVWYLPFAISEWWRDGHTYTRHLGTDDEDGLLWERLGLFSDILLVAIVLTILFLAATVIL